LEHFLLPGVQQDIYPLTHSHSFTLSILQSLMVHSVNLRESEIQLYAQSGLSIAHCPATLWKYVATQ